MLNCFLRGSQSTACFPYALSDKLKNVLGDETNFQIFAIGMRYLKIVSKFKQVTVVDILLKRAWISEVYGGDRSLRKKAG
jgi:hypothetical protein